MTRSGRLSQPVSKELPQEANNDNLQQRVVFSPQNIAQGKRQIGWRIVVPAGDESWRFLNPIGELLTKLRLQEGFFEQHDPFVIQPKR